MPGVAADRGVDRRRRQRDVIDAVPCRHPQRPGDDVRVQQAIGVGEEQPVAGRGLRADVQRVRLAQPALGQRRHLDEPHARIVGGEAADDRRRRVDRAIAHDDHLERDAALGEELADRGLDAVGFVAGRDDHRDAGGRRGLGRGRASSGGSTCAQRCRDNSEAVIATKTSATAANAAVAIQESGRRVTRTAGRHAGRGHRARSDAVVYGALLLQEGDRAGHLVEAVHAVLERDPAGEADAGEDAEDGVVVVEALAGLAVQQLRRVAGGAVRGAQVLDASRPARGSDPRRASTRRGA